MPRHWPGHKFLGPGTEELDEVPIDQDDWIARDHDQAYDKAHSSADIFTADSHAIQDFVNSAVEGNWHSAVGAGLLGIKHGVESAFNSLVYPRNMAPVKRTADDRSPGGGADENSADSKRHRRAGGNDPDSSTMDVAVDTDGEGASGSAVSANPIQICRSNEALAFGKSVIFKKSWVLTTWGFQTGKPMKSTGKAIFYLKTPLAYVPVDVPSFYMSPSEYFQLPFGSNAKKCFVKCTSKGYRFPFETNASTVTSANSEMVLFAQTATHLNHKYNLGFREYAGTTADPTAVSTGKATEMDWVKFFYGQTMEDSPAALPWLQKRLTHYAILSCGKDEKEADLPTLQNDINTFDLRTAQGIPVLNYDYEFNIAPLKDKRGCFAVDYLEVPTGTSDLGFRGMRWDPEGKIGYPLYSNPNRLGHIENTRMYQSTLEKQEYWRYSSKPEYRLLAQPDCYIGVIPPMTSNPFAANAQFQQVMAYWQFDTTLVVDFNLNSSSTSFPKYSASKNRYVPTDAGVMAPQNMMFGFMDGRRTQHMPYPKHEVHPVVDITVNAANQISMKPKKTAKQLKDLSAIFGNVKYETHNVH